ncbi:hypothetical protein Goshw_016935 [Gossypium schwendimanii]|uniref:Bifunctional inhibitor/plant lipid transfer protein/seed storage helical domain-containing protein n=1 Tax=Gossypium schwendimanii TaxID=34291 RepID=A0A7J9LPX0_GOSSC|nr:hypothetical protein [Gossypium schwendimanii]
MSTTHALAHAKRFPLDICKAVNTAVASIARGPRIVGWKKPLMVSDDQRLAWPLQVVFCEMKGSPELSFTGGPFFWVFTSHCIWAAMPVKLPQRPQLMAPPRPLCASQFSLVNYACAALPLTPFSPPPPRNRNHSRSRSRSRSNSRRRSRKHRRRHGHREAEMQSYCCQWLKQVDTECVCDVLVHLPTFLSRPNHRYTVVVDDTCTVNYSCGGRIEP